MEKEEIRDKLEDLYIKETGRFAFLMPNEIDIRYVEWLELQLQSKLHQPTVISVVCDKCGEEKEINGISGYCDDCRPKNR